MLNTLLDRDSNILCIYTQVIGTQRLPEYKERNKFPYVIATIQEALRIDTVGKNLVTQQQ